MPSKSKPVVPVVPNLPNTNPAFPLTESVCVKFTYNIRSEHESLTIRTDLETELDDLIASWKHQIVPKRERKARMNDGDPCPQCEGFMTVQMGHNRRSGRAYDFLSCSNYPDCNFTAYLVEESRQPIQQG